MLRGPGPPLQNTSSWQVLVFPADSNSGTSQEQGCPFPKGVDPPLVLINAHQLSRDPGWASWALHNGAWALAAPSLPFGPLALQTWGWAWTPSMLQTGTLVVGHCCLLPWGQGSCPSSCLSNQPLSSEDLGALSGHCGQRLDGTQAILRGTPPQTPGPFEEVGSRTPHHPASALTTSFGTAGGARVRLPPPRLDILRAEDRGCHSWGGGGTQACTCLGTDSCSFL